MSKENLIVTWLAAETESGDSVQTAMSSMNEILGARYSYNHLSMWRNGRRSPGSPEAINYLMDIALPYALDEAGIRANGAKTAKLKSLLFLPEKPVKE